MYLFKDIGNRLLKRFKLNPKELNKYKLYHL